MKEKTLLFLFILAGWLALAQPAQAFDPAGWFKQGFMNLDAQAETLSRKNHEQKRFSSGKNRNSASKRIKRYLKAERGKKSKG